MWAARRPGVGTRAPVGRDDLLAEAWHWLSEQHSVVLIGPPGAGRSILIEVLADRATAAGLRVLRAAPTEAESRLPFLALIDLLSGLDGIERERLPTAWRDLLAALERGEPVAETDRDRMTIRLAVVRLLAVAGPTLLVLDDLQWVDPDTTEVLRYLGRRLRQAPVQALAAIRTDGAAPAELIDLCPAPARVLALPPLLEPELDTLLAEHLGARLPRPWLTRVAAASGGNPRRALAIGQELRQLPTLPALTEPVPVPAELRVAARPRLTRLPTPVRHTLLLVSAATVGVAGTAPAPTAAVLRRAGRRRAAADLAIAADQEVVTLDGGGQVRFTDPLLGLILYQEAPEPLRRRAHAALSDAVPDPVVRAQHRALASVEPSEPLARALLRAAATVRRRGAPEIAAELAVLAADRSPAPGHAAGRLIQAATDALAAGHYAWAKQLAEAVLAVATRRRQRVAAWLVLLDAAGQALPHTDPLLQRAIAEAQDVAELRAQVGLRLVAKLLVQGAPESALTEARRCVELTERTRDTGALAQALCLRATAELVLGRPELTDTLHRVRRLAAAGTDLPLLQGPRHLAARALLHTDQLVQARTQLRELLAEAERYRRPEDVVGMLLNLAEVDLRAGWCASARQAAARARQVARAADLSAGPGLALSALAEAVAGDPDTAREWAERGAQLSEADGDRFFLLRNLHALGMAAMLAGDQEGALPPLRRAGELGAAMGELDPALFRFDTDLAEALIADQRLDEAAEVIAQAQARAKRCGRNSVVASLERAQALRELALGQVDTAAEGLQAAAAALTGLPLEQARSLLALGVAERRRRRRGAARAAFAQAWEIFTRAGAAVWAARAAAELTPVEPAADGTLTGVERRIAELVATGATNQQVARALSVSIKTVESYLTRIYRKLRVRSRTELAARLATLDNI